MRCARSDVPPSLSPRGLTIGSPRGLTIGSPRGLTIGQRVALAVALAGCGIAVLLASGCSADDARPPSPIDAAIPPADVTLDVGSVNALADGGVVMRSPSPDASSTP